MDHLASLRTFCAVVEAKSFTRAAQALGLSTPAVSRSISDLEERLGVRLFQRTTRHIALTEAAEHFYAGCSRVINELDALEADAGQHSRAPSGVLRLVAHATAAVQLLPPLINGFRAACPNVQIELTLAERPVDLVEEGYDLGIVVPYMLTSDQTITRVINRVPLVVAASAEYMKGRKAPKTPEDLATLDFVTMLTSIRESKLRFRSCAPRPVETANAGDTWHASSDSRAEHEIVVPLRYDISTNSAAFNKELVLGGAGLGILPRSMIERELASGRLVRILPEFELVDSEIELQLAWRDRRLMAAKVRAFVDFATTFFAAPPAPATSAASAASTASTPSRKRSRASAAQQI
ncbi:LysR family transcriptional regulator [Paraburkholderia kururiensis]|uniref:LysR family transcriptional regulator n=1 Tax=Paraburkholderia kururiensis TaxID=984307 RepID=UPI0005A6C058|nr:LysR family transcriptional regulator [Paraburkholderia kururiensis]